MTATRSRTLAVAAIGIFVLGAIVAASGLGLIDSKSGRQVGSIDYVASWSAWEVARAGGNPYDVSVLAPIQDEVDSVDLTTPQLFLYPPWNLALRGPIHALPFRWAVGANLAVNIASALGIAAMGWHLWGRRRSSLSLTALAAVAVFLPVLETIHLGQLSLQVGLLVMGGLCAWRADREVLAAVLFTLTLMKPQLGWLVLIVVAVMTVRDRRWKVAGTALATIAGLVAFSALLVPSALSSYDPFVGSVWRTATIPSWLRLGLDEAGFGRPDIALTIVPLVVALAVAWWAWSVDRGRFVESAPMLLVVGLLFAPYAWVFDASVLFGVHLVLVGSRVDRRGRSLLVPTVALHAAVFAFRALPGVAQHHMVWVPLLIGVLWMCSDPHAPQTTPAGTDELPVESSSPVDV